MLSPRLTNCPECANIPNLIEEIDCKLAYYANGLFNNITFMLNQSVPAGIMIQLIAYRRILTYKNYNPNYICDVSINRIASKVKLLTLGCNIKPIVTPEGMLTTTTTTTVALFPLSICVNISTFDASFMTSGTITFTGLDGEGYPTYQGDIYDTQSDFTASATLNYNNIYYPERWYFWWMGFGGSGSVSDITTELNPLSVTYNNPQVIFTEGSCPATTTTTTTITL
jgi:hypothetical protein